MYHYILYNEKEMICIYIGFNFDKIIPSPNFNEKFLKVFSVSINNFFLSVLTNVRNKVSHDKPALTKSTLLKHPLLFATFESLLG